eukprot:15223695-Alexandrium_andersonii.AAC.1
MACTYLMKTIWVGSTQEAEAEQGEGIGTGTEQVHTVDRLEIRSRSSTGYQVGPAKDPGTP